MDYQSLNVKLQETRLISIIATPPVTEKVFHEPGQQDRALTDIIRCRLDHVSLADSEILRLPKEGISDQSPSHLDWDESSSCGDAPQWRYSWGDYVALSYAWGDVTNTRDITVNGHRIAVGANLEGALRVLRHKQPIRAGYKIWVDALCINQGDTVERGQEVKRMGKIYKHARNVVIWLGSEGEDSDKAMDLIRTLSNASTTGEDKALGTALRQKPGLLGQGCWRALSQLLDRPYWDRLWVLQEIALGEGRTSILCGRQAVTWRELYDATYSFGTHNVDVMFSLIDRERKEASLPPSGLKRNKLIHLNTEQSVQAGRVKAQIMCMLDLGRKSLATDPRDKVYGLLAMMEASVTDRIVPDYNATAAQVFTDFAKAFIVACRSFLIPRAQSALQFSTSLGGARLIGAVKMTILNCWNNALGPQKVCHRGYPTGQTWIISVCSVAVQPTMLPEAAQISVSTPTIKPSHVKE